MALPDKIANFPIALVIGGIITLSVSWGFQLLASLGGTPEQNGSTVHYRYKPIMRLMLFVIAAAGCAGLWVGIDDIRKSSYTPGIILVCVGISTTTLIAMAVGGEIVIDDQGIHSRTAICSKQVIPWNDLSHVERFNNTRALTTNYYLRSYNGTTIVVGDSSFDTGDMLRRIRSRHPLPERLYQRRKWYGG